MQRGLLSYGAALTLTVVILWLGYLAFGIIPMLVFSSGFGLGYLLWLAFPAQPRLSTLKWPLLSAGLLFIAHRVEEYTMDFFDTLARLTDVATPDVASWPVVSLLVLSVGAWLAMPVLIARGWSLGYYLAWTFLASMGISEMAHFLVFPFMTLQPLAYFPGMATVAVLAPVAWWGMAKLSKP